MKAPMAPFRWLAVGHTREALRAGTGLQNQQKQVRLLPHVPAWSSNGRSSAHNTGIPVRLRATQPAQQDKPNANEHQTRQRMATQPGNQTSPRSLRHLPPLRQANRQDTASRRPMEPRGRRDHPRQPRRQPNRLRQPRRITPHLQRVSRQPLSPMGASTTRGTPAGTQGHAPAPQGRRHLTPRGRNPHPPRQPLTRSHRADTPLVTVTITRGMAVTEDTIWFQSIFRPDM